QELAWSFVHHYAGVLFPQDSLPTPDEPQDLYIAILPDTADQDRLVVTAPITVAHLQVCDERERHCARLHSATELELRGERRFFVSDSNLALQDQSTLVVMGYDDSGSLKARRDMILIKLQ